MNVADDPNPRRRRLCSSPEAFARKIGAVHTQSLHPAREATALDGPDLADPMLAQVLDTPMMRIPKARLAVQRA